MADSACIARYILEFMNKRSNLFFFLQCFSLRRFLYFPILCKIRRTSLLLCVFFYEYPTSYNLHYLFLIYLSFPKKNVIKEVHTCIIENDLDGLMTKTASPVPKVLLSCKDTNGLMPLHKASGMNRLAIVEYLLSVWPVSTTETDATGKTPLHWAASPEIFNRLVQAGADEQACDYVWQ